MKIVKSRLSIISKVNVPKVLTQLGVAFQKKRRQSFWLTNEGDLEYILNDFAKAKRAFIARHRPDNGSDDSFARLNIMFDSVERSFRRRINLPGDALALGEKRERQSAIERLRIAPDGSAIVIQRRNRLLTPEDRRQNALKTNREYVRRHRVRINAAKRKRFKNDPAYRAHRRAIRLAWERKRDLKNLSAAA